MKKAFWSFIVALLALGTVYWSITAREKSRARDVHAFGDLRVEDIVRLRVDYFGDSVTLIRAPNREGKVWLTAADSFPADTARLFRVLGHLLALQNREKVSHQSDSVPEGRDDTRLAQFGLDSAAARRAALTFASGRTVRVLLGKVSGIDYGSLFWKHADGPEVYRSPGKFVFEVSSRARDWKDTNLFVPFTERDIRTVTVEWTTSEGFTHVYSLLRDSTRGDSGDGAFILTEPFEAPATHDAASKIFRHAAQFKVDEFVAGFDSSASRAGLDSPVMTVRIGLKNGGENVVVAGNPVGGLYRYVQHPWHPDPVRVFTWRFEYFAKTGEDFLE